MPHFQTSHFKWWIIDVHSDLITCTALTRARSKEASSPVGTVGILTVAEEITLSWNILHGKIKVIKMNHNLVNSSVNRTNLATPSTQSACMCYVCIRSD